MLLTKDGVTFDVSHPADIARLKRSGYVEEKENSVVVEDVETKKPGKGKGKKGGDQTSPESAGAGESEGEGGEQ